MIVHILHHGFPLCRFSQKLPGEWPEGHRWVGKDESVDATCEQCKQTLAATDFFRLASKMTGSK